MNLESGKIKFHSKIDSDLFGKGSTYNVYVDSGSSCGMSWSYWDLYVVRGNEVILRCFDHGITQVRKGYENNIVEFMNQNDIPWFSDIVVVDEVKVVE